MRSKIMLLIGVAVIIMIAAIIGMKFSPIRHPMVKAVWKLIDKLNDSSAKRAVLPAGVKVEENISYNFDDRSRQLLDVYRPENIEGELPVIVYIHGGGFVSGDKTHLKQYCMNLAKEGYVVFNINYGLAPEYKYDTQLTDVMDAMAWVRDNGRAYNGNTSQIIAAGDSAGAYLAGLTACIHSNKHLAHRLGLSDNYEEIKLQGLLLFCGLYDLSSGYTRSFPSIKSDIEMLLGTTQINEFEAIDNLSVTKHVTSEFPPVFISSGEVDPLHPETLALVEALNKNKVYNKALLFDKAEKKALHGFQQRLELDISRRCMEEAVNFLNAVNNSR